MNTFGKVVSYLRRRSRMTLETVAQKIGSHKGYISGIENEKVNPPSVKFCRKIARIFKATLEKLEVTASPEDFVELAWASKAPKLVRERMLTLVATKNPLSTMAVPDEGPEEAKKEGVAETIAP